MSVLPLTQEEYDWVHWKIEGKTIRIFASYSSLDKNLAGAIKERLEHYSLSVFLAHEDIKPSVDWQNELVYNLRGCDIFMPILTEKFNTSEWTNQEVGFAFALGKTILPLKINVNPIGFITRVQALPFECNSLEYSCEKVLDLIKENPLLRESLKDCLIRALERSNNYDSAKSKITILKELNNFSVDQANNLLRVFIKNNQVRRCNAGKEFGVSLVATYDSILDSMLLAIFEQVKDNFYSPIKETG
jgi:hypothetical protein